MKGHRLPVLERLVLGLVRGPEAEFVVGDLLERYSDDLDAGVLPGRARRRLRRQVLATVANWLRPGAIADRGRLKRSERMMLARIGTGSGPGTNNGGGWGMGSIIQDVRIAARSIGRRPGFALGVALTLGLGIGATTTIYSVVDGVILSPLPFEDPEALVAVGTTFPTREWVEGADGLQHLAGTSVANYMDLKERARSFQALAAVERSSILLPDQGQGPQLATAAMVSPEFFDVLRVSPALGRTFLPEEHLDGSEAVLVLTYGAWQRRFAGDPDVVGRSLGRVGTPVNIIGVLPADFALPETVMSRMPDFFAPLQPDHARYENRGGRSLSIFGRLSLGTTVEEARVETTRIADELARDFPVGNTFPDGSHFGIGVNGLLEQTVGTTGRALWIFMGASGLLLMLAALKCRDAASRPGARPCARAWRARGTRG